VPNPREPTLADAAYSVIRHAIVRLQLPPGTVVSEQHLVEEYGLSKAAVRSGLARLRSEGLVSADGRGHTVAGVTLRDVQDVYDLRLALEPRAAEVAAGHIELSEMERLRALAADAPDLEHPAGVDTFLEANRAVHFAVAAATGNRRLLAIVGRLLDDSERVILLAIRAGAGGYGQRVHDEHRALLNALASKTGAEARTVMESAIAGFRDELVTILAASPAVVDRPLYRA
jgi:DNA-binding GntR family transcriptional regulator